MLLSSTGRAEKLVNSRFDENLKLEALEAWKRALDPMGMRCRGNGGHRDVNSGKA